MRFLFSCEFYAYTFIKKYILILFTIFALLSIVFTINVLCIGKIYSTYLQKQLDYNIYEYNEVDLEQLCRITNCSYVLRKDNNKLFTAFYGDSQKLWLHKADNNIVIKKIMDNYYIDNDYNILIYNSLSNSYFALNTEDFISEVKTIYLYTFLFVYFISFIFMYFSYKREMQERMVQILSSESLSSSQSMILITENVHHELNTPLEVIDNKLEKVHRIINEHIVNEIKMNTINKREETEERRSINKKMLSLEKDFDYIKLAIEQVLGTLDRMRGFKHLKYSNGNKTIYDICYGACKLLTISNSTFNFEVDEELKNYKIKYNNSKTLKNVDLLNAIINHLKNSLEAKSSSIIIKVHNHRNDVLSLHIIDDGNGIPKKIMNDVFKPNFSTKTQPGYVRGNGMYINKYILNSCGGDVNIIDTNNNGTIIEINILAYKDDKGND